MKAMIILAILLTLLSIGVSFYRNKNKKKFLISLGLFAIVATWVGLGAMTRTGVPLYIAHFVLVVIAWGALMLYIMREKLYWLFLLSPIATLLLFVVTEKLLGSAGQ